MKYTNTHDTEAQSYAVPLILTSKDFLNSFRCITPQNLWKRERSASVFSEDSKGLECHDDNFMYFIHAQSSRQKIAKRKYTHTSDVLALYGLAVV